MKNKYRFWLLTFVAVFLMVGFFVSAEKSTFAATGTNKRINFQGKVVNANGTNVTNGSYAFIFSLYTVASAGSNIWTETKSITVTDGIFQTDLGDTTALPGSIDFNTDTIYLGINFNGDGEMTPRVQFDAVPQAFNAQKVAGLTVTDTTGTLTIPNGRTISFASDFATSGAFATTLTSSGITNVTLPTTGTLLTNTASSGQTITSTQTSGTVLGVTDATNITAATVGQAITLSGTGAFDQTGLQFNLSGATGINLNDILGSASTWKVSRAGAGTFASVNGLAITNNGTNTLNIGAGLTLAISTANKTLTGAGTSLSIANSVTFGAGTTGAITLGTGANTLALATTGNTSVTLPTTGTLLTNTASSGQTITSTQTSGTVLGVTDATNITAATVGQAITLSGTGAFDQTGLQFNLSGATGINLNDILGSASTWKVSRAGAGTFASVTSPIFTSVAGLTLDSGNNIITIDPTDTTLTASGISVMTLASNAAITNASGNLILQPAGAGTTANVQIGTGGSGSATPDLLALDTKNSTGNPTGFNGAMYYNVTDAKFRCFEGGAWKDCDTTSGGTGYTTVADESVGLTARTIVNFTGAGITCVDNSGSSRTDCSVPGAGNGVSFATGTPDNTTGTNNLVQLQKNGTDKFIIANNGGVSVFGSTTNITKTSTGTTGANDFSISGSTLTNVTSQNDEIDINSGSVVTTFTSALGATLSATGAGGHSIVRDDGQILIIYGNSSASASLYNVPASTMTAVTVATGVTLPGAGAISLRRPDGKYLLIHGNGSAGLTSIFDPWGIAAAVAGPAVCGGAAATTGTNAFMRPDGKYVILCGGTTAWGVYDPTANTYTAGTAVTLAFGAGAQAVGRDDGTFLIFRGGGTTDHWLYNTVSGVMSAINPIITNAPTINTGAFSIRRNDGKWLIVGGAINTSTIYNPTPTSANSGAGSFELVNGGVAAAGFGPITTALGDAAQAVRRQDGKYIMVHGGASTLTDIIDPSVTTNAMFTAGTSIPNAMGAGGHFVPRPDGKYVIVRGGGSMAMDLYDMGFVMGGNGSGSQLASYETECITATSLNQSSTLNYNTNAEGVINVQVKTGAGLCSGTYKDIVSSGNLINPAVGDNRVQVKVFFKRPFFIGYDQDWSMWRGLSQPRYRVKIADPTLYDITIDNSTQFHRSVFDMGIGANNTVTDPSGPVTSNVNIASDTGGVQLSSTIGNQNLSTTSNASNPILYNGAFGTNNVLPTSAASGTIAIRRPNDTFMIISGNTATANAAIYNQDDQSFTAQSGVGNIPTAGTGLGALAFKRPDGKFLIVLGNSTNVTNIYDPITSTFTAGPVLTATAGRGAIVIPLPNGRVLIMHGNFVATSSVYDPVQNVIIAGPSASAAVGGGSMAIPRPDGTFLVVLGVATETCTALNTTTNNFDPYRMVFNATGAPAMTTGVGPGAFTFQRSDGQWVIVHGGGTAASCNGTNRTQIYNPSTNQMVVGPTLSGNAQNGAHAVQRPDGTWLIVHGGILTTTSIYLEKTGAFTTNGLSTIGQFVAGPALLTAAGSGATSFQRDDGKFIMITGNVGTSVQQYDAGWVAMGAYRTEQMNITDLSTDSTLSWKATPDMKNISAEVRTSTSQLGLQTASSRDVTTSGGLINPGGSDTWLQVQFNFKRTFVSNSSIWSDVWWNGGSSIDFNLRNITNPTLNEFKVNKDVNLMNLKADGMSVFRVSTNGDVYLSANGAVRSGGADLAENYTSSTPLETGEVVTIDPLSNHGVKRSQYQYQKDMLGIVSTAPGFVAGSHTEDSYPIALVGRVPVKVSTENGTISVGDHLTASSVPGYAMRANKAGRVLGMALENLDETKLHDCPPSDFVVHGRKCGEVMLFVNLVNYTGDPVQVAMDAYIKNKPLAGGSIDGLATSESTPTGASVNGLDNTNGTLSILSATGESEQFSKQQQILGFLNDLKADQAKSAQFSSEIFTDQLSATNGIITPQLVVDLIIAKRIKADSIEGLQIFTDKIGSLSDKVAQQGKDIATQSLTANDAEIGALTLESAKVSLNMNVAGKLSVGGLMVNDKAVFNNDTLFSKLVSFVGKVVFKNDVAFEKTPVFNKDTAGFAKIAKGADRVEITFEKPYDKTPIVQSMMAFDEKQQVNPTSTTPVSATDTTAPAQSVVTPVAVAPVVSNTQEAMQKQVSANNYTYFIVNRTTKGFTIMLNKQADEDLDFSWVAIAVADAQTFESKKFESEPVVGATQLPMNTPSALPASPAVNIPTPAASPVHQTQPIL